VAEVLVVDDESSDDTARIAAAGGARVLTGRPLPDGWAGKAWALQQGIESAAGEWVVTLDADTRPAPELPSAVVARASADSLDLVSVGGRFECPTPGVAWLHPAMLTTLVYRFGPAGYAGRVAPHRQLANGQCMAFRRAQLLAVGGMAPVAGEVVEDVALARHLAEVGWAVAMLDGADLLTTRMFVDLGDTWRGWARSLALPGVEPLPRQLIDLAVLVLAQALPGLRLLTRRADLVDVVLLATRLGTLAGTGSAYELPSRAQQVAYAASPLADPLAVAAVATGVARPLFGRRHIWRGRTYG
jgi:dolichol-phosphate mannosyltransferase